MSRKKKKSKQNQTTISNIGLFWHRDLVTWRGNRKIGKAKLLGIKDTAKLGGEVNFWEQTGIYALYADYHLVYVGQAGLGDKSCIGGRLLQHIKDDLAGRWNMFSWFGFRKVNKTHKLSIKAEIKYIQMKDLSNILEGILIEVAEPPLNKQKGRFGESVERYLQVNPNTDNTNKLLMDLIKKVDSLGKKAKV